jgi:hypothetical protein
MITRGRDTGGYYAYLIVHGMELGFAISKKSQAEADAKLADQLAERLVRMVDMLRTTIENFERSKDRS